MSLHATGKVSLTQRYHTDLEDGIFRNLCCAQRDLRNDLRETRQRYVSHYVSLQKMRNPTDPATTL